MIAAENERVRRAYLAALIAAWYIVRTDREMRNPIRRARAFMELAERIQETSRHD